MFGETTSMTGDGPLGYYLSQHLQAASGSAATPRWKSGCGIAPIKYQNKIAGPLAAMGDRAGVVSAGRRSLAGGDEHRPSQRRLVPGLSADHSPADGPHLPRRTCSRRATRRCASDRTLADLDREYTLNEIAIITRAGPARILGLKNKGHLGPGADADITIYTPHENKETMFELPRVVIKSGRVIVEQGEIRDPFIGKTLHVAPDYDRDVEADIQEWFEKYYSIRWRNYPVDDSYLHDAELVPTGRLDSRRLRGPFCRRQAV